MKEDRLNTMQCKKCNEYYARIFNTPFGYTTILCMECCIQYSNLLNKDIIYQKYLDIIEKFVYLDKMKNLSFTEYSNNLEQLSAESISAVQKLHDKSEKFVHGEDLN